MWGRVRGWTKIKCWRNYLDDKRNRGGVLLDMVPSSRQEAA